MEGKRIGAQAQIELEIADHAEQVVQQSGARHGAIELVDILHAGIGRRMRLRALSRHGEPGQRHARRQGRELLPSRERAALKRRGTLRRPGVVATRLGLLQQPARLRPAFSEGRGKAIEQHASARW